MTRVSALLVAMLLSACVTASPPAALRAHRECPQTPEAALALFATESVVGHARALRLAECAQRIARVYGLVVLSDAPRVSRPSMRTILRRLEDPEEIVRQEAIIAARKQASDLLPYLGRELAPNSDSAPAAAALLMVLAPSAARRTLAEDDRWDLLLQRRLGRSRYGSSSGEASLFAHNVAGRERAVQSCAEDPSDELDAPLKCFGEYLGGPAYARLAMNERALARELAAFDGALRAARGQPPTDDERAAELACRLAGICDVYDEVGAEREASSIDGVDSRGLPSMGQLTAAVRKPPAPARMRSGTVRDPSTVAALARFPRFPWPAPKPVRQEVIPVSKLGGPGVTLDAVATRLRTLLQQADPNFETIIFSGPPDGFVLMARMERIQSDGSPYPPDNRFTYRGNPALGFWDAVHGLVAERPGYFRVIAFVVTADLQIDPKTSASAIPIEEIGGPSLLPASVGNEKLGNRDVIALVYAFERRRGQSQRPWIQGAPSALTHLRLSGIGAPLGL